MKLNTYLTFNGTCADALKFYERCIGGKIQAMMTHGESPMAQNVAPEWRDKVIHAVLAIGDQVLMASDAPPQMYEKPQGFSVSLTVPKPADAERVFSALSEKGSVRMPLQQTFFSARFGMVVDQFGIPWMINSEQAA
jgi:PhnB protein